MGTVFQRTENRILAALSILLAFNSLFFISREVDPLKFLTITQETHVFYFIYAILFVLISGTIAFYTKLTQWRDWIAKYLIIFFPTTFLIIFGLTESKHFHYIFHMATGFYILTAGFFLINLHHTKTTEQNPAQKTLSIKQWFAKQKRSTLFLLTLLVAINLGFGSYQISNFAAVDEALWTFGKRISKYWTNIGTRQWEKTKVSDKPGVTVSIISGTGLYWVNPKEYKPVKWEGSTEHSKKDIRIMNFALRFPIVLFAALMLFVFYIFLERLFGERKALLSTIFIGTSPLLLGMARIINPDSILWIFAPLSIISYLTFIKRQSMKYLYWSGVFLGLALLTKYVANIIFILFFGFIFLEYIFMNDSKRRTIDFVQYIKSSFLHYIILTFIALSVFYILYPAVWIKPSRLLNATLLSQAFESTWPLFIGILTFIFIDQWVLKNKITRSILDTIADYKQWLVWIIMTVFIGSVGFAFINTATGMQWFNFLEILASPKSSYAVVGFPGVFLGNFFPLLFGIHPIALASVILFSLFIFFHAKNPSHTYFSSFYLIIFILIYYLGTTVNHVATIFRYQIMLFPIILIIAGIASATFIRILEKKYKWITFNIVAFLILILTSISLIAISPLYLGYASGFLPKKYHIDIKDMGVGSYEAAQFLNNLPDAKNITIWTDKSGVCTFFVGNCYSSFNFLSLREKGIDYVVVSAGRQSRTTKMINPIDPKAIRFDQYYTMTDNAAYELLIDGRSSNFVRVIPFQE